MLVGFGETLITPPLGLEMAGYFSNRLADGVLDELYSRALVVSEGDDHIALVVTDLISVAAPDVARVRELVAARTPIPPENVMVAATHTHTGPVTANRPGFTRDEAYMGSWADKTAEAVRIAFTRRVEAVVGAGAGNLPGVSFNRRYWMKNGRVHTNPGIGNPDIVRPAGAIDTQVTVLRFDDLNGNPIGLLTNFGCHTDTIGGTKYSADWVGVAVRAIRSLVAEMYGGGDPSRGEFGVIVLNGACGEINHHDVFTPGRAKRWPTMTRAIGVGLAAETMRVASQILPQPAQGPTVSSRSAWVTLERIPLEQRIREAQEALADPRTGAMERRRAQSLLETADLLPKDEPPTVNAEVHVLQLGPAAILGLPGEIFSESGLIFKSQAPQAFPMVANLANGALGYVPPYRAYHEGGYETRSAWVKPGSVERMVATGIELAQQCAVDARDAASQAAG